MTAMDGSSQSQGRTTEGNGAEQAIAVQVRGLVKSFGSGETTVTVLKGIDLDVYFGELLLLVGESGGGKTTLLSAIAGILDIDAGELDVLGASLTNMSPGTRTRFRGQTMGFIYQQFNLLPALTAAENVAIPLLIQGSRKKEAISRGRLMLERVGLGDRTEFLPRNLSGGQQQRVAIARALVGAPSILFADEPTGNLDTASSREIMDILEHLNREDGITIILVTHEPDIAAYASRELVMKDGQIVQDVRRSPHLSVVT